MPAKKRTERRPTLGPTASWFALLAATTLGAAYADTVTAEVTLDDPAPRAKRNYRLIVQTYATGGDLDTGAADAPAPKPLASSQRAVTAAELAKGVRVDLVEIKAKSSTDEGAEALPTRVVAWIEPGDPDLEFDARHARPGRGSLVGSGFTGADGRAAIRLARRNA